jgi:hypothetical protein
MKITDSKGNLYVVCPFLEAISSIIAPHLPIEEMFEAQRHLEAIREIAKVWQSKLAIEIYGVEYDGTHGDKIAKPYNYTAVLKRLQIEIKNNTLNEQKFNEIINLYQ